MKTIIAVPDFTREAHLKKILPPLISRLNKQGVRNKDIEILIGTGLHRKPSQEEIEKFIGRVGIKIYSHDYKNVFRAGTVNNIPVYLDKRLKSCGQIITIGVVEPHLYAGYSGGVKVLSIGLAGEKTINATHHPRFLDHPGTRICSIEKNIFQDFIQKTAALLPVVYSINIINRWDGKISKVIYGVPDECFQKAVRLARKLFEKNTKNCYDAVICDIPEGKGVNIYQASRIFNYVADTRSPVVKRESLILVKAGLEEGFGKGLGEKRFMKKILEMKGPEKLISSIKKCGCLAGEHRAYMVAKAMTKARLGFISEKAGLYKNKGLPFLFFEGLSEAKKYIRKNFKNPKIYRLKNAFTTILTHTPSPRRCEKFSRR